MERAGLAQLVEHRFCKPAVAGSSPIASSIFFPMVGYRSGQPGQTVNLLAFAFEGSNPSPTTIFFEIKFCKK